MRYLFKRTKMIEPIKIRVNIDMPSIFKKFDYITFDKDADIKVDVSAFGWSVVANGKEEVWVETLEDKIRFKRSGYKDYAGSIFILTKDQELLPYCMKDRLAYLQDRINKEK